MHEKKRMLDFLRWLDEQNVFIHYFNVNNLYYAIVEILDSITTPAELDEFGFEYFDMKGVLFETLKRKPEKLQEIMAEYKFPNLTKYSIPSFCKAIVDIFPRSFECTLKQKYLIGCLKKAADSCELVFLENNKDFIMQENYMEFYIDPIRTYGNAMHYFDEELSIQGELSKYRVVRKGKEADNYKFINSKANVWIQISDVIAGIYGKLFKYVNEKSERELINDIENYDDNQLECICILSKMRTESNAEDVGLIHSNTAYSTVAKMDRYLSAIEKKYY